MSPPPGRPLAARPAAATLYPVVYLWKGNFGFPTGPGLDRFEPLHDAQGNSFDVFDAADLLLGRYQRLFVCDVEGVRYRRPQFEYLQEIAQGKEMWVDAGARNVDEVTDLLVAGASKAVISTRTLQSPREISRTLKVTSQAVLEIAVAEGRTTGEAPSMRGLSPVELAQEARDAGLTEVILVTPGPELDLPLARELARQGPTYVGFPFREAQASVLSENGLAGGIFSAQEVLTSWKT